MIINYEKGRVVTPIEQDFVNQNIGNQPMPEHLNQMEDNIHNKSLAELALPQL